MTEKPSINKSDINTISKSNINTRVKRVINFRWTFFLCGLAVLTVAIFAAVMLVKNPSASPEVVSKGNSLSEPFLLATADYSSGSKQASLKLLMTRGKHITDGEAGPYGTDYYEGNLVGEVYDSNNKLLYSNDLSQFYSEALIFRDSFTLVTDDYNNDGQPDFTIGQYVSGNFNTYNIFSVEADGEIVRLPVENQPDGILCSRFEGYYSTGFKKVEGNGIKFSVYDMEKGKYLEKSYKWEDGQFIDALDDTAVGGLNIDKVGLISNEIITTKSGSSINSGELIIRLDRSDETVKWVFDENPQNIRVGSVYEGSYTGFGKSELLVLFKFLDMPHAAGLDFSVAAIYDRQKLKLITQKSFIADEAQFKLLWDEKERAYLLYSGTTTYQGYSTCNLQLLSLSENLFDKLPQNSVYTNGSYKFDVLENGLIVVKEPIFTDGFVTDWKKKHYLQWNNKKAEFEDFIPEKYTNASGEQYMAADSISPDGRYAAVSHEWGYDSNSYILIYDIKKNSLSNRYDLLGQEFGYKWSPDSKKLCITRLARIWIDTSIVDVEKKTLVSMLDNEMAGYDRFTKLGMSFSYKLNENRPDPYFQPCEWSPDSKRILMHYQWTDSNFNRQSGNFIYSLENKAVSGITQSPPEPDGGNLEPLKPKGFKW